jgi:hypothetical protein
MKRFIMMLVCAVALCSGCTRFSSGDIEVYDAEHNGHDYIIFENLKSGSITAVHSEDCQCKTNK